MLQLISALKIFLVLEILCIIYIYIGRFIFLRGRIMIPNGKMTED